MKLSTEELISSLDKEIPPDPVGEAGGGTMGNYSSYGDYTTRGTGNQGFAEFIPFEQSETLPSFPLEAISSVIPGTTEIIAAIAETVQAPLDMAGSSVLGALGIACRGRYPCQLPNGHVERPCLYFAIILPPSERKSGVMSPVLNPLTNYEAKYNAEHGAEVNQNRSELKLLQGRISSAEALAIKEKDGQKRLCAERDLRALNEELANFQAIEPLRLFGADVTPEKLAAMLKAQNGVFALAQSEGAVIFENMGRYSDKGGIEIYLNGYSGDRVMIDRKNSDSIVIESPTLSIIAPCQPYVIEELFSDRQKSGRGLLSRFLFVKGASRVGTRTAYSKPLDERIQRNYRDLCFAMLNAKSSGNLTYDEDGFIVYSAFFDEIEPQLTPEIGDLAFVGDWAGKLHGQMTRLAGLIHCIAAFERNLDPLASAINEIEATAAAALARYYLTHAKAVYAQQTEPQSVANARYLWGRIIATVSKHGESFPKRTLTRAVQGKRGGDFNLDESAALLAERGYVRIEYSHTGGAGRPTETIFVNPKAGGIVTKLTKLTKPPEETNKVNFVNKVTMNANSVSVARKQDELDFDPADDF